MKFLYIILTSIISIVVLFLLTKLIGHKQISQLSMFDYINGITIGSIASETAVSGDSDFMYHLTAMVVYGLIVAGVSFLTNKSMKIRRFVVGRSIVLMNNDKLYFNALKKAKIDMTEFLEQCRNNGVFDLNDIQTAIFEPSGSISILKKSDKRSVNPHDLQLKPKKEIPLPNVIIDGKILSKNLHNAGKDEQWLNNQLKSQGIKDISEVLLAFNDNDNKLTVYKKSEGNPKEDMFQ